MIAYLKLFRWPNLLMVFAAQYLLRYAVISPLLNKVNLTLQISDFNFFLLSLATVLIAAGGFAINDYFDIRIDRINKPEKMILGRKVPFKMAILFHTIFNIIGILIGFYVAYKIGYLRLGLFFIIIAVLLWFYSLKYKRLFLWGNFIVALSTAAVVFIVWFFEFYALKTTATFHFSEVQLNRPKLYALGYTLLVFLISFIREIIKDVEDQEGDARYGSATFPIVFGEKKTKVIIIILAFISILIMAYTQQILWLRGMHYTTWYFIFAIQIPLLILMYKTWQAKQKKDYHRLSLFSKAILIFGLLSMVIVYFNLLNV